LGDGDIEVLLWVDNDDPQLDGYLRIQSDKIKVFSEDRVGYRNFHVMVNYLCEKSKGDWLFLWNDDAIMHTNDWVEKIQSFDHTKPAVLNAYDPGNMDWNLFPIISREMFNITGHFSLSTHCDTWSQDIGNAVEVHYPVHGVSIQHIRDFINDQTKNDSQAAYAETSPAYYALQDYRNNDIIKIREWLSNNE